MKSILKQAAGIDVAKNELVVCLGRMDQEVTIELFAHKNFENSKKGFDLLIKWVGKMFSSEMPVRFVMEATGVYHESFAYFLIDKGQEVSIVLPNKISSYFRTLDVKTETDKTASEAIARFGLERKLDLWKKPKELFKQLKQLTSERVQIIDERTVLKNQIHAEKNEAFPNQSSLKRMKIRLAILEKQDDEIQAELRILIKKDSEVQKLVALLCTIPGIGILTAATVLGETNGFDLIRNKRQITSYAGLDVKQKDSGTSVHKKPRISKRGNKHLRKALHMSALCSIRCNDNSKAIFVRLVSRNGIKMQAVVAVQRRLLELMFILYKTQKPYDKNFNNSQTKVIIIEEELKEELELT